MCEVIWHWLQLEMHHRATNQPLQPDSLTDQYGLGEELVLRGGVSVKAMLTAACVLLKKEWGKAESSRQLRELLRRIDIEYLTVDELSALFLLLSIHISNIISSSSNP